MTKDRRSKTNHQRPKGQRQTTNDRRRKTNNTRPNADRQKANGTTAEGRWRSAPNAFTAPYQRPRDRIFNVKGMGTIDQRLMNKDRTTRDQRPETDDQRPTAKGKKTKN